MTPLDRTNDRIRVASIGLGWVTTHRHLPVMRRDPNFEVVGLIDRKPQRAENVARQLNIRHHACTGSLADVPWLDDVDAVTVGACPHAHYPLIAEALRAGKHVLTEKPFTMSVAEGEELVRLAAQVERTLCIVHNFQFASSTKHLLHDIERGAFGNIRSIAAHQFGNPERRLPAWYDGLPLGLFYDESPHMFYLLRRLAPGGLTLNQATVVPSSTGLSTPCLITVHYRCDAAHGAVPVMLNMNFESPVSEWQVVVCGERYMGIVDVFRDIYIRLPNDGAHTTATVLRTSLSATWQHWLQHFTSGVRHLRGTLFYGNDDVFSRFAASIRTGTVAERIGADDALAILGMQHQIIESANHA
ncbi:Gfo/Idh/MocA family oxidoreductase [Burkholderia stagnalis]|uniref:Gfo/Idh/MocA family protein n=1 Tax=Burkholderia stagnalis TaxID=1503054 RepID=UPI002AB5983C|nr:Gfo/Idh/MocA family oxidoreductase [Burkholderia stagnalis]MDY7802903.1 Gfo/Idh/MocA family oxidoreductase [Burkholderia stagnalis]